MINLGIMKTCDFENCDRKHYARGYCATHYEQLRRTGELQNIQKKNYIPVKCLYGPCERDGISLGYCRPHYLQWKAGKELVPIKVRRNSYNDDAICEYEFCDRKPDSKGYCKGHYNQVRFGVELRPIKGTEFWKPETKWSLDSHGYVVGGVWDNDWVYRLVKQHRYFMERELGRKLLPEENVHHINGVRDDNRIENLELWSTSQPYGQRVSDKVKWAKEILDLYGDLS